MCVLVICYVNHGKTFRKPFRTGEGSSQLPSPLTLIKDGKKKKGLHFKLVDRAEDLGGLLFLSIVAVIS